MKRLWTPSFTLLLAAGATFVLLGLAWLLDGRERQHRQPLQWSFVALGRNALLVYIGQHVVFVALGATPTADGTAVTTLTQVLGSGLAVALFGVVVWWVVAAVLRALRWYVTL